MKTATAKRLNFYGAYVNASWYLTGERRPYDRLKGCFKRLVPRRNFDFGRGGAWGAFEVTARVSYTDLDDRDVHGGRIGLIHGRIELVPALARALDVQRRRRPRLRRNPRWEHALFQTRVGVDF